MIEEKHTETPSLRFPEFAGRWIHQPLTAVLKEKKKRNIDAIYSKEDVLSVSGEFGVVNQIEHLGRSYAGINVDNYHVVEKGDIVYTKSPLKLNPYGIIKANKGKPGIVSTLYAVYEVRQGQNSGFWDQYFSLNDHTNRYLRPLVHKGAKNDMKISNARVLIDPVFVPPEEEQTKINLFLNDVDKKIALLREQKSLFSKFKKGCMQAIFAQEIRFRNAEGKLYPAWRETKLSKLADRKKTKNRDSAITRVLTNSATRGIIDQRDYFDHDVANSNNLSGYYVIQEGEFVYNPRISVSAPVGPIKRNNVGEGIMSPLYTVFGFKEENTDFWYHYFDSAHWHRYIAKVANFGARHDRMAISNGDFMDMPLLLPHPDEQQKIADFLSAIDRKIELVETEFEQLKTFKKGLLQKMFI